MNHLILEGIDLSISFLVDPISDSDPSLQNSTKNIFLPPPPSATTAATLLTTDLSTTFGPTTEMPVKGCNFPTFDVSKFKYPGNRELPPFSESLVKCLVIGLLILIAVIGNVLIIVIVSMFKNMRTTTNCYIVNLAIADLMVALVPMTLFLVEQVDKDAILGHVLCKFNSFISTSALCAISFTMMAIAGDRFFAIVFPLKARVTQRKVKFVVALIWFCVGFISIPPALYLQYIERHWIDYLEVFCHEIWPMYELPDGSCDSGKISERTYWTIVMAVLNWIPMIMMTINYLVIIHRLQFSRLTHNGSDKMSSVQRRSAKRVVVMMLTLLITFMVCTVPFQVCTLFDIYKDAISKLPAWYDSVRFAALTLTYAHSTVNPIIYGAMSQSFRNGFRHLLNKIQNKKNTAWESKASALDTTLRPNITNISVIDTGESAGKRDDSWLPDLVKSNPDLTTTTSTGRDNPAYLT